MNLRCLYCQTPFTLSRVEMLTAIVTMNEKNMSHYDAHCPRCRRANSISRQRMELFFPNWREAAKQMESAPAPASAAVKTEPLPKAVKEAVLRAAAAQSSAAATAKPASPKRQRAGKTSGAKKTTAAPKKKTPTKPAAKSTTKPAKPAAKSRKK